LADLAECHGAKGAAKGSLSFTNLDGASRDRFRWKRLAWDFLSYPSCDQRLQAHIVNYALWLFVLGPIWAGVYFVTFYFLIRKLNLVTPGREAAEEAAVVHSAGGDEFSLQIVRALGGRSNIVSLDKALGGKANIQRVDACAETRLRIVTTNGALDEAALKAAGIEAIVRLPPRVVHLLTGLNADQYAAEMRGQLASRDLS
jgi:phosphotransferase system IIB component